MEKDYIICKDSDQKRFDDNFNGYVFQPDDAGLGWEARWVCDGERRRAVVIRIDMDGAVTFLQRHAIMDKKTLRVFLNRVKV
jgi:hypothetical protein